jgi:hypothetical protein
VSALPDWISVGGKNQFVADAVKRNAPVLTVGMLRVAERSEKLGVIAMGCKIFVADAD